MAAFKKRHGKHLDLYLLLLPALLSLIVFKYVPMYGIIIAFKDYSVSKGVLGSPWVGLQNLEELLRFECLSSPFSIFRTKKRVGYLAITYSFL